MGVNGRTMDPCLIFDFDYTLGDTTLSIAESVNYALGKLGYPPCGVAEIKRTIGYSLNVAFRMLTGEADEEKETRFFDEFQVKADEVMTKDARLYDGVREALCKWGKTHPLGIVSTKHRFRIADILKKFDLTETVSVVVGNEDVAHEKPHPEGILRAASLLGSDPAHALYVGDSVVDAEAAMRAGMAFVGVLTGTTFREQFSAFPHVAVLGGVCELDRLLDR